MKGILEIVPVYPDSGLGTFYGACHEPYVQKQLDILELLDRLKSAEEIYFRTNELKRVF
jgi:hypothetical protein